MKSGFSDSVFRDVPTLGIRLRFLAEPKFLAALAVYAVFYSVWLAKWTVVRVDEFSYLESVAATYAHGRVVTHDWLTPFNALLSVLGAGVFAVTRNFHLATYGVLWIFSLFFFASLYLLLRARMAAAPAGFYAILGATFPIYLHKSLEYHGSVPTLACFLAALLAFEARKDVLFFIFAFLAVSSRQNSIALLLLPLARIWTGYRSTGKIDFRTVVLLAGFAVLLLALRSGINVTWDQRNQTYLGIDLKADLMVARAFALGLFLVLAFQSAAHMILGGGRPGGLLRENLRRYPLPLALTVVSGALLFSGHGFIWFQAPFIGSLERHFSLLPFLGVPLMASLWFLDRRLIRFDAPLLLAAGYLAFGSLRGAYWDYYLAEPALAALWMVLRNSPGGFSMRPALLTTAILALACHLLYAYACRINLDKASLAIRALEGLERQGRVSPASMTNAPFGFLGFKLFPLLQEDYPNREVADFSCYVQAEGVVVESGLPWREGFLAPPPAGAEILATGHARIGFRNLPYRVVDRKNPKGETLCHGSFRFDDRMRPGSRPFPLDNSEWERFAESLRTGRK